LSSFCHANVFSCLFFFQNICSWQKRAWKFYWLILTTLKHETLHLLLSHDKLSCFLWNKFCWITCKTGHSKPHLMGSWWLPTFLALSFSWFINVQCWH
jgi:hypothetical protein